LRDHLAVPDIANDCLTVLPLYHYVMPLLKKGKLVIFMRREVR
jgi:hypothetical protein